MSAGGCANGFLAFSAEMTAFTVFELQGTGQTETYFEAAIKVVGEEIVDDLLAVYAAAPAGVGDDDRGGRDAYLRRKILGDERLGPVARNIIKLWYVGIWYELPPAWATAFGLRAANIKFMASAQAYTEGLLWPAIGANPPGAKAPGFASWVGPPRIPTF